MKYVIKIRPSVLKAIAKIEKKFSQRIIERIDFLSVDPRHHGSIKLSGEENAYRTRVGKYRIIYEIYDAEILYPSEFKNWIFCCVKVPGNRLSQTVQY